MIVRLNSNPYELMIDHINLKRELWKLELINQTNSNSLTYLFLYRTNSISLKIKDYKLISRLIGYEV